MIAVITIKACIVTICSMCLIALQDISDLQQALRQREAVGRQLETYWNREYRPHKIASAHKQSEVRSESVHRMKSHSILMRITGAKSQNLIEGDLHASYEPDEVVSNDFVLRSREILDSNVYIVETNEVRKGSTRRVSVKVFLRQTFESALLPSPFLRAALTGENLLEWQEITISEVRYGDNEVEISGTFDYRELTDLQSRPIYFKMILSKQHGYTPVSMDTGFSPHYAHDHIRLENFRKFGTTWFPQRIVYWSIRIEEEHIFTLRKVNSSSRKGQLFALPKGTWVSDERLGFGKEVKYKYGGNFPSFSMLKKIWQTKGGSGSSIRSDR